MKQPPVAQSLRPDQRARPGPGREAHTEGHMEIDLPEVVEEVRAAFMACEKALVTNDVGALDRFFWVDDRVLRYGLAENLYGHKEIAAFRQAGRRPTWPAP